MRLTLLSVMFCLAGCASGHLINPAPGSGAEIAVFRPDEFVGSAVTATIYLDDVAIAELGPCEWFVLAVDPGKRIVRAERSGTIAVEVAERNPAYVMVDPNMTEMFGGGFYVREVTLAEAQRQTVGCKELK